MVEIRNPSEAVPGNNDRFEELGKGCYAFSADGCSNTGVIIGERGVLVVDPQATPALAEKVLQKIRELTDKPIKQVVLTHFHADSTLGATAFEPADVVASDLTRRMIDTRGSDDIRVLRDRDAALFSDLPKDSTVIQPSMTIASSMTIDLGGMEVRLMHLGRGHTMGDMVVWVPQSSVIFAGDLVQKTSVPYCGDAHLTDWPRALDRVTAFRPNALMPGRGKSAKGGPAVATAVEMTRDFVITLRDAASACVEQSLGLRDTYLAVKDALAPQFGSRENFEFHLPFNVARAYDEALGLDQPQIWTLERCADLVDALGGTQPAEGNAASGEQATATEQSDAADEDQTTEQPLEDQAAEEGQSELVTDNEFAASLVLEAAEDTDGEDLDLSADDIVEENDEAPAVSQQGDGENQEKVLENVR